MHITIIIIIIITRQFWAISVSVQAQFDVETHLAEGHCLDEQANMAKVANVPSWKRNTCRFRCRGTTLMPLKILIKQGINITKTVMQSLSHKLSK
jgi:hypothetical protein